MPRHSTARRFEAATGGRIKWHQFFEEEQGITQGQESPEHGKEATSIEAGAVQCELAPQHGQAA